MTSAMEYMTIEKGWIEYMATTKKEWTVDAIYDYLIKNSVTFPKFGLDQQGEVVIEFKKILDKWV